MQRHRVAFLDRACEHDQLRAPVVGRERLLPTERFVRHHADGIDVAANRGRFARQPFGREVSRRAEHDPGLGEIAAARGGDAEVGELGPAALVEQDVARFDVAVQDPVLVRRREPRENILQDGHDARRRHRAAADLVMQRRAGQRLHHEIDVLAVVTEVVDRDDVRVARGGGGARFVLEASEHVGTGTPVRVEHLDRDVAGEPAIACEVHGAHAALAEERAEFVPVGYHRSGAGNHRAGLPDAGAPTTVGDVVARLRSMQMDRFTRALAAIDARNADDPNEIVARGETRPKELAHADLVSEWVRQLRPDAGEALLLAARGHHLRRWTLPRASYPTGRAGYLRWRRELKRRHAAELATILGECGYDGATIDRVGALVQKVGLGRDPDVQALEDAICLVFLETQLADVANRFDEPKAIEVLAKTAKKMSPEALHLAARLPLDERGQSLLRRALGDGTP